MILKIVNINVGPDYTDGRDGLNVVDNFIFTSIRLTILSIKITLKIRRLEKRMFWAVCKGENFLKVHVSSGVDFLRITGLWWSG